MDDRVTMELIDACYHAAGFQPRPRTPRMRPPRSVAGTPPGSPPPG
jgi:hypothetical protein